MPASTPSCHTRTYPWRRYWARFLDSLLATLALGFLLLFVSPAFVAGPRASGYGVAFWAVLLWIPIEAVLLTQTGTTPGKALFRIRVRGADGARLGMRTALARAARVWALGTAAGLPLLSFPAAALQWLRLRRSGQTSWDAQLGTQVHHAPLAAWRWGVLALVVAAFLLLGTLGD